MPKIVIEEIDQTSPGIIDESTDVVYIPGFVDIKNENLNTTNPETGELEYIGIKVNEPTLFTSITQFETLCGTQPAYFSQEQRYEDLSELQPDGSVTGFSDAAVPYHGRMFSAGQADPSYVMAKEILSAGLSVLYERVNNDDYSETYNKVSNPPTDWNTNYMNYEIASQVYTTVVSPSAPEMFTKQNGFEFLNSNVPDSDQIQYYTKTTVTDPTDKQITIAFVPVASEDVITYPNSEGIDIVQSDGLIQSDGSVVPAYYVQNTDLLSENDTPTKYYLRTEILFTNYEPEYQANKYGMKSGDNYILLSSSTPPADWGIGTYYENTAWNESWTSEKTPKWSEDPVVFTQLWTPEYSQSNFYNPQFQEVTSKTQPDDWETATDKYFTKEGNVYTGVTSGTAFNTDTQYYQTSNNDSISSSSQPEDWGTGVYFTRTGTTGSYVYTQVQFLQEFKPQFNDPSLVGKTIITQQTAGSDTFVVITEQPADWGNVSSKKGFYYLSNEMKPEDYTGSEAVSGTKYIPHAWIVGYKQGVMTSLEYTNVVGVDIGNGQQVAPTWDPSQIYRIVSNGIDIKTMYDALQSIYAITDSGLSDKGNYSIKYLTSGGYPTYEYSSNSLVTQMIALAKERGDCVAFIDHTDNPYRNQNIDQPGSLYYAVRNDLTFQTDGEFATMFTPWAIYNRTTTDSGTTDSTIRMAGSFAYFLSLADSITVNPNWLAIAGVARGLVQNLASGGMTTNIPNGAADAMEPRDGIAINPITNIKPYGYTIWGNRTLKKNAVNLTATSFLNIRNLVSDIKKEVYRTARKLTFEQNNDVLWVNFKAEVSPLLERMLHGYGISSYKLQLDTQHPRFNERATLCVKIIISPIEPVEDFYVTIIMQDDENVTITE